MSIRHSDLSSSQFRYTKNHHHKVHLPLCSSSLSIRQISPHQLQANSHQLPGNVPQHQNQHSQRHAKSLEKFQKKSLFRKVIETISRKSYQDPQYFFHQAENLEKNKKNSFYTINNTFSTAQFSIPYYHSRRQAIKIGGHLFCNSKLKQNLKKSKMKPKYHFLEQVSQRLSQKRRTDFQVRKAHPLSKQNYFDRKYSREMTSPQILFDISGN